jgi:multicomponent Na+:H+ antiporter subunit C
MSLTILDRAPFLASLSLWMLGFYLLLAHRSLMKAVIGLSLFQSGIIIFFIMLGVRDSGTIPIVGNVSAPVHNPLPHALMLTAIVVGVATLGVALAILRRIQEEDGSIDDPAPEGGDPR